MLVFSGIFRPMLIYYARAPEIKTLLTLKENFTGAR